jgi:hypothetical protein
MPRGLRVAFPAAGAYALAAAGTGYALAGVEAALSYGGGAANLATLSLAPTGTTGSPSAFQVTLNGPSPAAGNITVSAGAGGTLSQSVFAFAAGETGPKGGTVTYASSGVNSVSISSGIAGVTAGAAVSHTTSAAAVTDSVKVLARTSWAGSKPWTTGILFGPGEIPTGQTIGNAGGTIQVDVRNRHPDGSLRFAVLSGITTTADTVMLRNGTPATGSNVAEPTVAATVAFTSVVDASAAAVAGGSFTADIATARTSGVGAWSRTTARKVREILGPVMSEFHYFVPTADTHTSVWFYVRAYSSGDVEVETAVENGWFMVASPGSRTYNATVSIAGSTRYTGTGLVQLHHTRWSRVDWSGTDPAAVVSQDVRHLHTVPGMPNIAVAALDARAYTIGPQFGATKYASQTKALAEQPTPFTLGNFDPALGGGGYTDAANVWASWDMAYLAEGDARALYSVLHNTRASGYFSTHYRDEATGRPVCLSSYPNSNLSATFPGIANTGSEGSSPTPAPTGGGTSVVWYHTHAPRIGDMAYLLTGRWSALEECQFISASVGLTSTIDVAYGGFRIARPSTQAREVAFMTRDIAAAAVISPQFLLGSAVAGADAAQRAEHVGMFDATVQYCHDSLILGLTSSVPGNGRLVNYANNVFGVWPSLDHDATANDRLGISGMMMHYLTACLAQAACIGASVAQQAKLRELAAFTARHVVGMLGSAPGSTLWDWRMATYYSMPFGAGGTGGSSTYPAPRASWDAQWSFITGLSGWVTNPSAVAPDNFLWRMGDISGSMTTTRVSLLASDMSGVTQSESDALAGAIAWAADLSLITSVPGIDGAMSRFYGSDTWADSVYGGAFRSYPGFAYRPKDAAFVSYALPAKGTAKTFAVNTADSVRPSGWGLSAWRDVLYASFSAGVVVPTYSKAGAYAWSNPGGHGNNGYPGVIGLDYSTGMWWRALSSNSGVTDRIDSGQWTIGETNGSPAYEITAAPGQPAPSHTSSLLCFSPGGTKGKVIMPWRWATTTSAVGATVAHETDLNTNLNARVTAGTATGTDDEGSAVWHASMNRWWWTRQQVNGETVVRYLDRTDYAYKSLGTFTALGGPAGFSYPALMLHKSHVNGDYLLRWCGDVSLLHIFSIDNPTAGWLPVTITGTWARVSRDTWTRHSDGRWYAYSGISEGNTIGRLLVDPVARTATADTVTVTGDSLANRAGGFGVSNSYTRFHAIPALNTIGWIPGGAGAPVQIRP